MTGVNKLIAVTALLLLLPLLLSYPSTSLTSQSVISYTDVVTWLDWVMTLNIDVPSMLTLGTVTNMNVTITLKEKGLGRHVCITSVSASLSSVSVSTYLGFLKTVGDSATATLQLPVVSTYSRPLPGNIIAETMQISVRGYVELENGTRRQFSFAKTIPVNIYAPPTSVVAYVIPLLVSNGVELLVNIQNLDIHPVFNTYVTFLINSTRYSTNYLGVLEPGAQKSLSQILPLSPGTYRILAVVNYTTIYGVSSSYVATTIVIVPATPSLNIVVNATRVVVGQGVEIKGFINPRATLGVILEYSLNAFDWSPIATIEARNSSFTYTWRPSTPGVLYLRARTIETERYKEAISNTVTLTVEKVAPSIRLSADSDIARVGTSIKLEIEVRPNITIPITIMYKKQGESAWRNYTTILPDKSGKAAIASPQFTDAGIYIFKAVAQETSITTSGESNEVMVTVYAPATSAPSQTTTTTISTAMVFGIDIRLVAVAMGLGIAVALLLFAGGRRR